MKLSELAVVFLTSSFLLITGCSTSSSPSTTTTPPANQQLTLSSSSLAFGSVTEGQTSAAQTVTLSSTGGLAVAISSITLSDTADYTLAGTCSTPITVLTSCTLSVTFKPQSAASLPATITIDSNGVGSPQTIALTGTGTASASEQLTLSSSSLAFGSVTDGQTSAAQTVTLSSTGGLNVAISSITLSDTADYTLTGTCSAPSTVVTSCTISVTFKPQSAASLPATITIDSNGVGSPQTITLTGTGASSGSGPTEQITLSSNSLAFGSVTEGQTSAAQTVTLSSTGGLAVAISSITLSDTTDYAMTGTCSAPSTLVSACTLNITFKPQSAVSLPATITIDSNGVGSPQTITLTGTGTTSSSTGVTRTLYVFPATFPAPSEPDASVTALYTLINNAKSTVDMTMYELQDTTFSGDLVADCNRGVKVRVILSSSEKSSNTPAYTQLNAVTNCSAVFSNTAFTNTHQKTITVDDTTTAILSLNLQTQYYSTTRDFALVENDPADIAAIEATFAADYAAGTPSGGTQGASDFSYIPGGGDTTLTGYPSGDLIWSPTTAQADMLSLINNAQATILLENEEMSATNIVSALETACQTRHVTVQIAMVNDDNEYASEFSALVAAGCGVHTYPDTTTGFYVHAKAVVADYGLSTQAVYMGSINYSTASMNDNRELGIYITDPTSINTLETTMAADYAGGTAY